MHRSLKAVFLFAMVILMAGCAAQRHRDNVAAGLLTSGTPQKAFLEVWGPPSRTRTELADTEERRVEFSRWGGFSGRVKTTYEIWEYPQRDTTLIFDQTLLVGWKTSKTTEQLRTP